MIFCLCKLSRLKNVPEKMFSRSPLSTLKNLHLYNLSTWDVASEVKAHYNWEVVT